MKQILAAGISPEPPPLRWATTRQGHRELATAGLLVLAIGGVPAFFTELYPFSRAPMFADAPVCCCEYEATDPDGRTLDPASLGLQRNYWGNPLGVGVGFEPLAGIDTFGTVPTREAVTKYVEGRLAAFPQLSYVEVTATVVGAIDQQRLGVVTSNRWVVDNPHYRKPDR